MKWIKYRDKRPKPNKTIVVIVYNERNISTFYDIIPSSTINKDGRVITTRSRLPMDVLYWLELPDSPQF